MTKKLLIASIGSLLLLSLGCSDEPAPPSKTADMTSEDMGHAGADTPDDSPDMTSKDMTCTPITVCPQDSCGMVDDRCGGQLDCGPCACENGQPTSPSCGLCGLGSPSCEGDTLTCSDVPSIPGLASLDASQCEAALLYVDLTATEPGLGTKASPFPGLRPALDALKTKPQIKAILIKGDGSHAVPDLFELSNGVSLIGGFDSNWKPKPDARPLLEVGAELPNKDIVGLQAKGIDQPTLLYNLRFKVRDNATPGRSTYGLYLQDSDALELVRVDIESGKAGDGLDGEAGSAGKDGVAGNSAAYAHFMGDSLYNVTAGGGPTSPNFTDCMTSGHCVGAAGGLGRMCNPLTKVCDAPKVGSTSAGNGQGGDPGALFSQDGGSGSPGRYADPSGDLNGKEGKGGGSIMNGYWVSSGAGADGQNGQQGSGGGGGGGAYSSGIEKPPYCGAVTASCPYCVPCPAPSGGSGGGGGEGGTGGKGGSAGGSSFGVLIINGKLKATDSLIKAGFAGVGGDGANGGLGGLGGRGGLGGNFIQFESQRVTTLYRGGSGANGQDGQKGGNGGGGAGGDSYAVYCLDGTLALDPLTRFEHGGSANGGMSEGNRGEAGRGIETFGCN